MPGILCKSCCVSYDDEIEDSEAEGEKGVSSSKDRALLKDKQNSGGLHVCLTVPHHPKCFMVYSLLVVAYARQGLDQQRH